MSEREQQIDRMHRIVCDIYKQHDFKSGDLLRLAICAIENHLPYDQHDKNTINRMVDALADMVGHS